MIRGSIEREEGQSQNRDDPGYGLEETDVFHIFFKMLCLRILSQEGVLI